MVEVRENATTWRGSPTYQFNPQTNLTIGKSGQSTYYTAYKYNSMGALINVNMCGTTSTCTVGVGQGRTFAYDSLKRLLSATNPESGAITYKYDPSGNMTQKVDGSGLRATINIAYDGMNRPVSKSYTGSGYSSTPTVYNCYDGNASFTPWQGSLTYCPYATYVSGSKLGHLTYEGNGSSYTQYTNFSQMGYVLASSQTTPGGTGSPYNFTYGYDLAGSLTSTTYPSQRTVTTKYDSAERLQTVSDSKAGHANFAYTPWGAPQTVKFGGTISYGGVWAGNEVMTENRTYDPSRMQLTGLTAIPGGNSAFSYTPLNLGWAYNTGGYSNTGNVTQHTINVQDASNAYLGYYSYTQNFGYDAYNRLSSASESGNNSWTECYGYDPYGNRWLSCYPGLTIPSGLTPTTQNAFDGNNRLVGVQYDGAGNQTGYGSTTLSYDAENHQTSAYSNYPTLNASYVYDAAGRRVQENVNGVVTTFVYDAFGKLAAEYSSGNTARTNALAGTVYRITDGLGSTRMTFDGSGSSIHRYDYLPFGEELNSTMGVRASGPKGYGETGANQKFTGKLRDAETGLDYSLARYLSGPQGRFTAPDVPVVDQHPDQPQSWNLYAYVRNNPLIFHDPSGTVCISAADNVSCLGATPFVAAVVLPEPVSEKIKLPENPSKLGPEWARDFGHKSPNGETWVRPDGTRLDFDKGNPKRPGWRGKDHWHVYKPGQEDYDRTQGKHGHLKPGDEAEIPDFPKMPKPSVPEALKPDDLDTKGYVFGAGRLFPLFMPNMMPVGPTVPVSVPTAPVLEPVPVLFW